MNAQGGMSNSGAAVRGLLLVVVAVVVGVLLLRSVDDPAPTDTVAADTTSVPSDETLPPDAASTTTAPSNGGGGDTPVTVVSIPGSTDGTDSQTPTDDGAAATTEPGTISGFTPRDPSEVSVQVANSTGIRGAAGRLTDRFKSLGYITRTAANYAGEPPLARTVIHYQGGSLLEARVMAKTLELDSNEDVQVMLSDTGAIDPYETADVLVLLGTDLAE